MRVLLVCISLLVVTSTHAQTCDKEEAKARIEPTLSWSSQTIPVGKRFIMNDGSNPGVRTYGPEWINANAYTEQQKLAAAGLVTIIQVPHTPENGWNELDALSKHLSDVVDMRPSAAITSDPTYQLFKVQNSLSASISIIKAVTDLIIIDTTLLRSATDAYCLVSFTYHTEYNPRIAPALGFSLSDDRKARQLAKYDVFKKQWIFVTMDGGFLSGDFNSNNVENVVARFNLIR